VPLSLNIQDIDATEVSQLLSLFPLCPQAAEVKAEADELREQQRDMMTDVKQQVQSAEDMLEGGIRQQQVGGAAVADVTSLVTIFFCHK